MALFCLAVTSGNRQVFVARVTGHDCFSSVVVGFCGS
jgi:hypothetical protein